MKRLLSLLLVFSMFCSNAFAVTGVPDSTHWVAAGFGGAGTYSQVVMDHFVEDKVYAIGDVNSPFVSTDAAENWSFLSQVGAANSGYTIKQTAGFVQSTNDANLMFAIDASNGGLNRSLDGGQTWTKVASFTASKGTKVIAIDKNDDNKVWVASGSSLHKSTDKGVTWTDLGRPFDSRASTYTTQTTCTNAGASWSATLGICTIAIRFVYHDAVNNDLYLGSQRLGMVRYDVATDAVEYIDLAGTNGLRNYTFDTYIDGSSVENLCVASGNRIACTADFSTWTYTAALTATTTYFINAFAVHRKADTTLNFVANIQLLTSVYTNAHSYSTDSGATWSTVSRSNNLTDNPTGAFSAGIPRIFSIENDPNNDGVMYMTSDWRIYRSSDSGANFSEKVKGAQMQVSHDIKVAPNGTLVMVSMDTGVQYSEDFGVTWIQGTPSTAKGQPFVTGSANDYGGHYWQVELAGTQAEWDADQGKIFVCATMYGTHSSLYNVNYLLKSVDSGATWTRSNSGLPTVSMTGDAVWGQGYCRAMGLSADETILYIGMDGQNVGANAYGGVYRSDDEGATFTKLWPKTPNRVFNALAVDPTDSDGSTFMFGTFRYNMYRITNGLSYPATASYVGDSGGPTDYIVDVAYDSNGTPYAVTDTSNTARIYKSVVTDYGDGSGQYGTFRLMKNFNLNSFADGLVIDPQNDRRIFVSLVEGSSSNSNRIFVTPDANQDSGATWYDITGDFPVAGGCRALAVHPNEGTKGFLYCASNGGGIWKLDLADSPLVRTGQMVLGGSFE